MSKKRKMRNKPLLKMKNFLYEKLGEYVYNNLEGMDNPNFILFMHQTLSHPNLLEHIFFEVYPGEGWYGDFKIGDKYYFECLVKKELIENTYYIWCTGNDDFYLNKRGLSKREALDLYTELVEENDKNLISKKFLEQKGFNSD